MIFLSNYQSLFFNEGSNRNIGWCFLCAVCPFGDSHPPNIYKKARRRVYKINAVIGIVLLQIKAPPENVAQQRHDADFNLRGSIFFDAPSIN